MAEPQLENQGQGTLSMIPWDSIWLSMAQLSILRPRGRVLLWSNLFEDPRGHRHYPPHKAVLEFPQKAMSL